MDSDNQIKYFTILKKSEKLLLNCIENIEDKIFQNYKSRPEDWTIAQIVRHIILTEKGIVSAMLTHHTNPNNEEVPSKINDTIKHLIATPIKKTRSPKSFIPQSSRKSKIESMNDFKIHRTQIVQDLNSKDLKWDHFGYKHFILGQLNNKDSITFIHLHCERHIHQIKNILSTIDLT
jgi:hypothetical protein